MHITISTESHPTNGEIISMLFPNTVSFIHDVLLYNDTAKQKVGGSFNREWWDAPYKVESEEQA